ncbi:SHOCT domain-containing protein [Clostridium sp. KNHs216]|uniref:SHOCT domain-containing protein n=1 Tax=Clostridium sp. KNHs216 TaxID=1550235 RepID=UPI001151049C|nr:SHOCT domain-containing protein [Clostridium sp. KNHs216]TQI67273.1 hypothetical protein LY85_1960 [Clostridium sp. KNHs216]
MMMIMIGMILAFVAITYFSIRNQSLSPAYVKIRPDEIELLDERLANGEISYEEYQIVRNQLLK